MYLTDITLLRTSINKDENNHNKVLETKKGLNWYTHRERERESPLSWSLVLNILKDCDRKFVLWGISYSSQKTYTPFIMKEGDNGLFITLVPKV